MKYIWHNGGWTPAARAPRVSAAPYIIRDGMGALRHPATGEMFDSKSQFRRATKDAGCEELGNDVPLHHEYQAPADIKGDIAEAINMLEQGYEPEPCPAIEGEVREYT